MHNGEYDTYGRNLSRKIAIGMAHIIKIIVKNRVLVHITRGFHILFVPSYQDISIM